MSTLPVTTLIVGASPDLVELARELGKRGEQVALISRNPGRLTDFRYRLTSFGVHCEVFTADVTESSSVLQAFTQLGKWSKRLDRMIYNVGVVSGELASEVTESELARVMSTNFFGFVNCFQLAHEMFKRQKSGHAIVISSADAITLEHAPVSYAASKAALQIYIQALRAEVPSEISISEIFFGKMPVSPSGHRWLNCDEIVSGLIQTIDTRVPRYVVGEM